MARRGVREKPGGGRREGGGGGNSSHPCCAAKGGALRNALYVLSSRLTRGQPDLCTAETLTGQLSNRATSISSV